MAETPSTSEQNLTAELKDGQLQIVEVSKFTKAEDEEAETVELETADGTKFMQVLDSSGKGLMQLDLLNLTLVRCEDGEDGYRLISNADTSEGGTEFMSQNTVTCVLQSSDGEEHDGQESYVVMEGNDDHGQESYVMVQTGEEIQELDEQESYVMVDGDQGPVVYLQSDWKKSKATKVPEKQKTETTLEMLEKAQALHKAKVQMRHVDDCPVGVPLEKPLIPPYKRRRVWTPTGSSHEAVRASAPELNSPTPATFEEYDGSSSSTPRAAGMDVPLSPIMFEEYDGSSSSTPRAAGMDVPLSPIMFEECDGSSSSSTPRAAGTRPHSRSLRDTDFMDMLNYGSESDSDDVDAEEEVSSFKVPRVFQFLNMDTPEDEEVAPSNALQPEPSVAAREETAASGDFYSFQWRPFPNPPIPPESRRETFSSSNGPTVPMIDPYEIFIAIWNQSFVEYIVSETNRYAQQLANKMLHESTLGPNSRICDWFDTTYDEILRYFAILLTMGVLVKTSMVDYWNATADIFVTPGFRIQMSLRRFQLLSKCLHFANSEDMCGRNLDASEAKLFKIAPVLNHLNAKFSSLYNLGQNIALDESLLQWKGCLSINQLIPNKAAKVGVKSYAVCESQTGYLWRFKLHAHPKVGPQPSAAQSDPMSKTTPALVLNLVRGLENKGHTLWMDSYYNSPALTRKLKSLGFDVAGTLRTNRQFVPVEFSSLTKSNMKPGDITGLTSGDVDLLVWRDQNRVAMISTYHGDAVSGIPPKPILVQDYNICMGGVDKKDQMLAMYPIERKRTKVWYKKLFRHLLNTSVLNGYIIHKESLVPKSTKLSHRQFRVSLIKSLLSKHQHLVPRPLPLVSTVSHSNIFVVKDHFVAEYPLLEMGKRGGKSNGRVRRSCTVCHKRTQYYCVGFDKPACFLTCFRSMHS